MATKTAAAEKPKTYHDGIENGLAYKDVSWDGTPYRLRQIGVLEADAAYDGANDEKTDKLNWRLYNRLALAHAIVTPPTTLDDIQTWSNAKLAYMLEVHDTLGTLRLADTEGN